MTQKKKTLTSNFGFALAEPLESSLDLRLLSIDKVANLNNEYRALAVEDALLYNIVPTKQNFFYAIDLYDNDSIKRSLLVQERGVGEIYKKGRGVFLKREHLVSLKSTSSTVDTTKFYQFPSNNFITIWSYVPESYIEALTHPFSVLCSLERNVPTPVELEENTLLGRLDNTIQSIDKDELRRIFTDEAIVDAVNNNKSSLILLSKFVELLDNDAKFFAPSISLKAIYTNKKKPPKPARGTIIFNDQAGCFEGFDGVSWRKLKWGDE